VETIDLASNIGLAASSRPGALRANPERSGSAKEELMLTWTIAIAAFVGYTVWVAILWRLLRVRYDELTRSRSTVLRGIVAPIGTGLIGLVILVSALDAWPTVLVEDPRSAGWTLVAPAAFALAALVGLTSIDLRSPGARILPVLAVGVLLVGAAEELLARGIVVIGIRDSGAAEIAVLLGSAALFSLLHGINALFGQSRATTLTQVAFAFVAGAAFYSIRMSTGLLVMAMLLHALWDFASLGAAATGRSEQRPVVGLLQLGAVVVGAVVAVAIAI
jgi:membrane protease YdiL (CAAX protease family)